MYERVMCMGCLCVGICEGLYVWEWVCGCVGVKMEVGSLKKSFHPIKIKGLSFDLTLSKNGNKHSET